MNLKNLKQEVHPRFCKGMTLVEVLVATSIILVFLTTLFTVNNVYLRAAFSNFNSVKATFLAEEGLEAVRFLRDVSWEDNIVTLATNTDYHLAYISNTWQATTSTVMIDSLFDRLVVFASVYRDSSGDIVSSSGTLDNETRLVTVTISWRVGSATTTRTISTYLSNIIDD